MTICVTKRNKISLDADNNVLNFDGKIAAIVHQYDRKPDIVRKFNNKYNDAVLNKYFTSDKIKEANKVHNEIDNKINQTKKIKIIRKTILFSFIIVSSCIIFYCKARRSGLFKSEEIIYKQKKLRIKSYIKRKKKQLHQNTTLSSTEGKIIESK